MTTPVLPVIRTPHDTAMPLDKLQTVMHELKTSFGDAYGIDKYGVVPVTAETDRSVLTAFVPVYYFQGSDDDIMDDAYIAAALVDAEARGAKLMDIGRGFRPCWVRFI